MTRANRIAFEHFVLAYLGLVLVLGGASAAGFYANMLLQVLGTALIGYCLVAPRPVGVARQLPWRSVGLLTIALIVVQLLPLPPAVWALLPGREAVAAGFDLMNVPRPWLPVSLDRWDTVASLTWLIPALALLLALLRTDSPSRKSIIWVVTVVAVSSVAVAALQRTLSGFYFYAITNHGAGVGFFANANHQATFMLMTLALWAGARLVVGPAGARPALDRRVTSAALFWVVALVLVIGIIATGSLAGLGLMLLVGGAMFVVASRRKVPLVPLAIGAAMVITAGVASYLMLDLGAINFGQGSAVGQTRLDFLVYTFAASLEALPLGTGIATFQEIYRLYEPAESIGRTYVNHAHNDYVELLLETGVLGIAIVALFVRWWVQHSLGLWRKLSDPIALAASLAILVVLIHSIVDYPLRTAAIESMFAICAALMVRGPEASGPRRKASGPSRRTVI